VGKGIEKNNKNTIEMIFLSTYKINDFEKVAMGVTASDLRAMRVREARRAGAKQSHSM
jgi:hypothetical protein